MNTKARPRVLIAGAACVTVLLISGQRSVFAQEKQAEKAVPVPAQTKMTAPIMIPATFHVTSFAYVDGKILLRVRLNNKLSANMVLDTGADTCLLPQVAASLGLKLKHDLEVGPKLKVGEIATLTMESLHLHHVEVEVTPLLFLNDWNKEHPQSKIIGLLGLNAIEDWALGLDFVSHTIGWWEGGKLHPEEAHAFNSVIHAPGDVSGGFLVLAPGTTTSFHNTMVSNPAMAADMPQSLPIYSKQNDPQSFLQAKLDGVAVELGLDTGTDGITVSEVEGAKFHALVSASGKVQGDTYVTDSRNIVVLSLTLGRIVFDFPSVMLVHPLKGKGKESSKYTNILGMNVLANCRLLIDFPGKTLYVSAYANYNRTPQRTLWRLGMIVAKQNNQHVLYALLPDHPAAQEGMHVGDRLLDINGMSFEKWLAGSEGPLADQTVTLQVRRHGIKEPLKFTLLLQTP